MNQPAPLPVPEVETSPDARPYWEGAREGRLVLPRCLRCAHVIWYPRPFCPLCGSLEVEWFEAGGEGRVYSFTIVHRSQDAYRDAVPYALAYVELSEGPRVLTNIVPVGQGLEVGQTVRAFFDRDANGEGMLRFRPV